ncbi:MAG: glyoxylate/hydroxypyruvate reductase A [Pseudomonadota bacterium]
MTGPLVLYAGRGDAWPRYRDLLGEALAAHGVAARVTDRATHAQDVDYIVYAPNGPITDFRPFTRAKAVLSLWAGVEKVVDNPTLTQPLCRLVDPGLTQAMAEWVCAHVLRHHLDTDRFVTGQDGVWRDDFVPPLAGERRVGILGMGVLGQAAARALAGLGFRISGWSRTAKTRPGFDIAHGTDGLRRILEHSEILVLLLPATPETHHLLNARTLAQTRRGAVIVNPGRGTLIDDAALLAALDGGHVAHATLDVFAREPLPVDHPFWAHPRVTVTPHIAAATRPETAAQAIAENIARAQTGQPLLNRVDRDRGY